MTIIQNLNLYWHIQVIDIHATWCNGNERSEFLENGLNDNFPAQSWVICASFRKYVGGEKKAICVYLFICLHFFHENEFHIVSQNFRHWSVNYLSANFCKPYKGSLGSSVCSIDWSPTSFKRLEGYRAII